MRHSSPQAAPADQEPRNLVAPTPAGAERRTAEASAPAIAPRAGCHAGGSAQGHDALARDWRAAVIPAVAPEIEHELGEPTIWLNLRALPDPTPRRPGSHARSRGTLSPFRKRHGADWAPVLGVLRAQGERGAGPRPQRSSTRSPHGWPTDTWKGALAMSGRTAFADRAEALADLNRSVGIEALVIGLEAAKAQLTEQLLADSAPDLRLGREISRPGGSTFGSSSCSATSPSGTAVTVSSLFSGTASSRGRVSSRPTCTAMRSTSPPSATPPIAGHQQPGSITEEAVRSVLLLPAELQPQQVISLLGLGGPSFPLADHYDHIHVGSRSDALHRSPCGSTASSASTAS